VLLAKRRNVLKQGGIELPRFCHLLCCACQVDGVPERDGSHNQTQPACAMPLILEGPVMDFAEPIEEYRNSISPVPFHENCKRRVLVVRLSQTKSISAISFSGSGRDIEPVEEGKTACRCSILAKVVDGPIFG
jgi:hypothetical protein